MKLSMECIPCFLGQMVHVSRRLNLGESDSERLMMRVMDLLRNYKRIGGTAEMSGKVMEVLTEISGLEDPYLEDKRQANRWMTDILQAYLEQHPQMSFAHAARLAVAGNVIDLGAFPDLQLETVLETIHGVAGKPFVVEHSPSLEQAIRTAQRIVYITDNAGEVIADRHFLSFFPQERVTLLVRGAPVLNDVTLNDAQELGLHERVEVLSSGHDGPGFNPQRASQDALARWNEADLVISKGQANFESLHDCQDKHIVFMLMAKCGRVARVLHGKRKDCLIWDNHLPLS